MVLQPDVERMLVPVRGHVVAVDAHLRDDPRPPVAFAHGLLTSVATAPLLFTDPARESWISVSLPGHRPGHLAAGTRPAAIDADLVADLMAGALDAVVGSRPVIAVGWSTGGFAALALAARHPGRVAGVASLAGFARGRSITGSIAWLAWLARGSLGAAALRAGLWAGGRVPGLHHAMVRSCAADRRAAATIPPAVLDQWQREFARHDPAELAVVLAALGDLDIEARLADVAAPAWIAAGGLDPLVPVAEARHLAGRLRRATLAIYETGGHLFFHEWARVRDDFAAWRAAVIA